MRIMGLIIGLIMGLSPGCCPRTAPLDREMRNAWKPGTVVHVTYDGVTERLWVEECK